MMFATGIIHSANFFEIIRHPWFVSAFIAGGLAQVIKFVWHWAAAGKADLSRLKSPGGMPSSHSALVSALAAAVGFTDGFDAPYAMIAVGFGLLVMCDAATLRHEAGEHARVLNKILAKLNDGSGESGRIEAPPLKERLGHRRREVLAGVALGVTVAFAVCAVWDFWK